MPTGIVILGILLLICGIWGILWGLGLDAFGGLSWLTGVFFSDSMQSWGGAAVGAAMWSVFVGIVQIITAFGLFARQRWAWLLALIGAACALVGPVIGLVHGHFLSLFGLIIPGIIFFYLLRDDDVQQAFGRA